MTPMKRINRLLKPGMMIVAATTMALTTVMPLGAQESGLTEQNCVVIKTSVQQVQRSDLEARIIRGRAYGNILSLMAALNGRLALNNMSDPRMVEIANELNTAFPDFGRHYSAYETSLETLQGTNCKTETSKFNGRLNEVRQKRTVLKGDVERMKSLIDEYQAKVKSIKDGLKQEGGNEG